MLCVTCDDAESALEAGAIVTALAQNLANAAGPSNPGLLADRRPVSNSGPMCGGSYSGIAAVSCRWISAASRRERRSALAEAGQAPAPPFSAKLGSPLSMTPPIGRRTRAVLCLATSRSIGALFAQPSFRAAQ